MTLTESSPRLEIEQRNYTNQEVREIIKLMQEFNAAISGYQKCLFNPNDMVTNPKAFVPFARPLYKLRDGLNRYEEFFKKEIEEFDHLIGKLEALVEGNGNGKI